MDDFSISISSPSCFHLPYPTFQQAGERLTNDLIEAIINIVTALLAVIVNVLVATAILSSSRQRTPLNLLIACLAFSDVFVGLTAQPGYITYGLLENQHRSVPRFVRIIYCAAFYVCIGVSFMILSIVSYEQFLAVRLRITYDTFFSSRRAVKYLYAWHIYCEHPVCCFAMGENFNQAARGSHLIIWLSCLLVLRVTQIGILVIVRRTRRQIRVHLQAVENRREQREAKLA